VKQGKPEVVALLDRWVALELWKASKRKRMLDIVDGKQ